MDNEKRLENLEKRMEALELQIQELPDEVVKKLMILIKEIENERRKYMTKTNLPRRRKD